MTKHRRANETGQPLPPGSAHAAAFGGLVRERREALGMKQDALALATGVGRRFIIELEAGKANAQLGKSLLVAEAVGLRFLDLLAAHKDSNALLPDMLLPELAPEAPEDIDADTRDQAAGASKP